MKISLIDDEEEWNSKPVADLIEEFQRASDALEDAKRAKAYWSERLEERLVATERKTETIPWSKDETKSLRVTRVSNRRFSVDTSGLIKQFGKRKVNAVLKEPEVDKAKLDAALKDPDSGFTSDEVFPFIKVTDAPYVRLYVVDRKEEEDDERDE